MELIKSFEGYRRSSARLADGRWTIGYGHTKTAREGVEVSPSDAEALLIYDLMEITQAVNDWTFAPLTQNQFDALVSFAFNVGLENFRRSMVLRRVNEGAMLQAAAALDLWRKADFEGERIVVDALVRRRAAEKSMFLLPTGGYVPAPSPVLPPKVDQEGAPTVEPLKLVVPMDGDDAVAEADQDQMPLAFSEDKPTALEAVAAAVSERLQAIDLEPEVEPVLEVVEPEPQTYAAEVAAALQDAPAEPPEVPASGPVDPFPVLETSAWGPSGSSLTPYIVLGVSGLILFGGGVAFGVTKQSIIGWMAALLGIIFAAAASYYLLDRLGGDED